MIFTSGFSDFFILHQLNFNKNLIKIGEAMNGLLKLDIEISNSRKIVEARNKLTYCFDEIENVQIWNIIINHLPTLKEEIKPFLV